jgi:hypothetical protein
MPLTFDSVLVVHVASLVLNLLGTIKQIHALHDCIDYIQTEISSLWQLNMEHLLSSFIIETARDTTGNFDDTNF